MLVCGAVTPGIDVAVLPSLPWTSLPVVMLTAGTGFGSTASILAYGEGAAMSLGLIDIGAPADELVLGIACDFAAGAASDVACAVACCAGSPGARKYQHMR